MISIITPTYNEADTIALLAERVRAAMGDRDYELIVVDDDSPDHTWEIAAALDARDRVRVLRRRGARGLASAVFAGMDAARGGILGVIDADLSHPPEVIPRLLAPFEDPAVTMVVASRLVAGGGVDSWPMNRKISSYAATVLARPFTSLQDPMSGFFFFRREVAEGVGLRPIGYKIGLEIAVRGRNGRIVEIPYVFEHRATGTSKLTMRQNLEYLAQLALLAAFRLRQGAGRLVGRGERANK